MINLDRQESKRADPNGNCNVCVKRSVCKEICSILEKRLSRRTSDEFRKREIQMHADDLIYFSDTIQVLKIFDQTNHEDQITNRLSAGEFQR